MSSDEEQAKVLRLGGFTFLVLLSLFALPYGLKYWLAALFVFVTAYTIGVSTGWLSKSIAARVSRRRVARGGGVDFAGYTLTLPVDNEPHTFDLQQPHTLVLRYERSSSGEFLTEMFIAQGEASAVLYSRERSDSETARDYGYTAASGGEMAVSVAPVNRHEVPLRGLHELARMIEERRRS